VNTLLHSSSKHQNGPFAEARSPSRGQTRDAYSIMATAAATARPPMAGPARTAAPVAMGEELAEATTTLRVGSGGVMLPNHAPLVVAEQFGTLEALHPGRIDLGIENYLKKEG